MRIDEDLWRGAAAGALGGAVGAVAMVVFNNLLGRTGFGREDLGRHHREHRVDAKPNDTDGTIADEPASRKAASSVAEVVAGTPLDEREKDIGGPVVHILFGAGMGALYGAAAARVPAVTWGAGLPFGAVVWLTAAETGLPLVGLARNPKEYPTARHIASLATHLIYGATTDGVLRGAARCCGVLQGAAGC